MFHFKGVTELEIRGKKRLLKFNMRAISYFCDLQNLTIMSMARELGNPKISTLASFLYAGAVTYSKSISVDIDFTEDETFEWVDELGMDRVLKMITDLLIVPADLTKKKKAGHRKKRMDLILHGETT